MPGRASFLLPDRALPENEINRNQVLRTTRGVRETASALSDEIAARLSSAALLCTSKVDPFSSNNRCLLNSPSERLTDSREQPMSALAPHGSTKASLAPRRCSLVPRPSIPSTNAPSFSGTELLSAIERITV